MDIGAIVMAAGLGTRMKSDTVKVLHPICGKPMVAHVLDLLVQAKVKKAAIVVSYQKEKVIEFVKTNYPKTPFVFVDQKKPLGTGHAVLKTQSIFKNAKYPIVILSGDVPGLTLETLRSLIQHHVENKSELTLISAILDKNYPYGRVIRNHNHLEKVIEAKDATREELQILEMNMGLYCVNSEPLFSALKKITPDNAKQEYYLTDIVEIFENKSVFKVQNKEEVLGINDRYDLAHTEKVMRRGMNRKWMLEGVTIVDPQTTRIDSGVKMERDIILHPQTYLQGETTIGKGTVIGIGSIVRNSTLGRDVVIKEYSVIENSRIDDKACIGPFARLRPKTHIKKEARVGNFVELKKTTLGEQSKANHLAYLGDAVIGKDVNVGCGVITCNYDGGLKYSGKAKTIIGDKSFIGSDCQLVAPIKIQKGSYIASGTTVSQNVSPNSLVIARAPQIVKKGYMKKMWRRARRRKTTG